MDNSIKQCPRCGMACEPDHAFCAKCGYSFGAEEYNKGYGRPTAYEDTLDGVPTAEVVDYVGKNSESFLPKFFKYSYGAKAGWNWPVFLWGMIGLPFVWFFHRKMYKVGAVVLAATVAIVLAMAGVLCVALNAITEPVVDYLVEIHDISEQYDPYHGGIEDLSDFYLDWEDYLEYEHDAELQQAAERLFSNVMDNDTFVAMINLFQILSYLQTAFIIILPIFANYLYYKKAMGDIKRLNAGGYPDGYTVHSAGGTKTSAAVLSALGGYALCIFGTLAIIMPVMLGWITEMSNLLTL